MNTLHQINNWKAIILAYQIGYTCGLKSGQSIPTEVWEEVEKRHPNWVTRLGITELNKEELAQEYASHGKRVLMIKRKDE